MIAVDPAIFKSPISLRFRTTYDGSDRQSECYLLCVDMWEARHGRIAIIPRVKVAYKLEVHHKLREQWPDVLTFRDVDESIDWIDEPPALVRKFPYGPWATVWAPPFED